MNKYITILISYMIYMNYASSLSSLDYKYDIKNKIIVNDINQAYYNSGNCYSCGYLTPKLKHGMNYTDHSNTTNLTLNNGSISYRKNIKYSRSY